MQGSGKNWACPPPPPPPQKKTYFCSAQGSLACSRNAIFHKSLMENEKALQYREVWCWPTLYKNSVGSFKNRWEKLTVLKTAHLIVKRKAARSWKTKERLTIVQHCIGICIFISFFQQWFSKNDCCVILYSVLCVFFLFCFFYQLPVENSGENYFHFLLLLKFFKVTCFERGSLYTSNGNFGDL